MTQDHAFTDKEICALCIRNRAQTYTIGESKQRNTNQALWRPNDRSHRVYEM